MFNVNFCKNILAAFLNTGWQIGTVGSTPNVMINPAKGTSPSSTASYGTFRDVLPTDIYLAFGTEGPGTMSVSDSGALQNFTEPSSTTYDRILLTANGVGGNKYLDAPSSGAASISVDGGTAESHTMAYVTNSHEFIMGPYTDEDGWGNVDSFAVFKNKTGMSDVIFYGKLDSQVTVAADRIPIIKKNDFKISLG